jgi:hypothetical protein
MPKAKSGNRFEKSKLIITVGVFLQSNFPEKRISSIIKFCQQIDIVLGFKDHVFKVKRLFQRHGCQYIQEI